MAESIEIKAANDCAFRFNLSKKKRVNAERKANGVGLCGGAGGAGFCVKWGTGNLHTREDQVLIGALTTRTGADWRKDNESRNLGADWHTVGSDWHQMITKSPSLIIKEESIDSLQRSVSSGGWWFIENIHVSLLFLIMPSSTKTVEKRPKKKTSYSVVLLKLPSWGMKKNIVWQFVLHIK